MKWLIISLAVLLCTNKISAQVFSDQLLCLETKVFETKNDTLRNDYLLEKYHLALHGNDVKYAYNALRRVRENLITDSLKRVNFLWNAALTTQSYGDIQYPKIYLSAYSELTGDTSTKYQLLNRFISASTLNSNEQKKYELPSDTSIASCVVCLEQVAQFKLKNKWLYTLASGLVPGLGTYFAGDFYNGTGSIITVGGSTYLTYYLVQQNLNVNAVVWGVLFVPRFYFGNMSLTKTKVNQLEQKKKSKLAYSCEAKLKNLFINNSINYRLD